MGPAVTSSPPAPRSEELNNEQDATQARDRVDWLEMELRKKIRDNESLEARVREYERERVEMYGELEQVRSRGGVERVRELEEKVASLVAEREAGEVHVKRLAESQSRLAAAERQCRKLREDRETYSSKYQILKNKADGCVASLKKTEEENKKLVEQLKEVEGEKMSRLGSGMGVDRGDACGEEVEDLRREIEDSRMREEQLCAALRNVSGQVAKYEGRNRELEMWLEAMEKKSMTNEHEARETQEKLEEVQSELLDSQSQLERTSAALRALSGRIASLEIENGRLERTADAFDKERCEFYREKLELMERLSTAAQVVLTVKSGDARMQASMFGNAESTEFESQTMVGSNYGVQDSKETKDIDNLIGTVRTDRACVAPSVKEQSTYSYWKWSMVGVLGTVAIAVASKLAIA